MADSGPRFKGINWGASSVSSVSLSSGGSYDEGEQHLLYETKIRELLKKVSDPAMIEIVNTILALVQNVKAGILQRLAREAKQRNFQEIRQEVLQKLKGDSGVVAEEQQEQTQPSSSPLEGSGRLEEKEAEPRTPSKGRRRPPSLSRLPSAQVLEDPNQVMGDFLGLPTKSAGSNSPKSPTSPGPRTGGTFMPPLRAGQDAPAFDENEPELGGRSTSKTKGIHVSWKPQSPSISEASSVEDLLGRRPS